MVVAAGGGLGDIIGVADVEYALEALEDAELAGHPLGVRARAVGEDELAARQPIDRRCQLGVLLDHRQIEVVHVVEEGFRIHAVHLHQAGQRGAELAIVGLLQVAGVDERHAEEAGDELAHLLVDLGEQVALGGIERVVEIEDPHARRVEPAPRRRAHSLSPHFSGERVRVRGRRLLRRLWPPLTPTLSPR